MEKNIINKQESIIRIDKMVNEIVAAIIQKSDEGFKSFRMTVKVAPGSNELKDIVSILKYVYDIKIYDNDYSYLGYTLDGFKQFELHLYI